MSAIASGSTRLHVSGRSEVFVPPERATLHISVQTEHRDKEQASLTARQTANQVAQMLRELNPLVAGTKTATEAAPVTWWTMDTMSLGYKRYDDPQGLKQCTINLRAKFRAFDKLSDIVGTLSAAPHVRIASITWALTDATRLSRQSELRRAAVADAKEKLQDYVSALELQSVRCVELHDCSSDYRGMQRSYAAAAPMMLRGAAVGAPQDPGIDLNPDDVRLEGAVNMVFEGQ